MLVDPRAHLNGVGQQEGGALFQLGDVGPAHHQLDCQSQKGELQVLAQSGRTKDYGATATAFVSP